MPDEIARSLLVCTPGNHRKAVLTGDRSGHDTRNWRARPIQPPSSGDNHDVPGYAAYQAPFLHQMAGQDSQSSHLGRNPNLALSITLPLPPLNHPPPPTT